MADTPPQLTREQLYQQVYAVGKEEYILGEMRRLGFWNTAAGIPQADIELSNRKSVLQKELSELVKTQQQFQDKQHLIDEMRKERMRLSLLKREETKQRHLKQKQDKADKWAISRDKDIVYLGEGVSGGLSNTTSNTDKLAQLGLPVFANVIDLCEAMGVTPSQLRFLAYHRKSATTTHYRRFTIAKKTGGVRTISAPMPRLKKVQHWILENLLYKLQNHNQAHGFIPQRSIISNAEQHVGSEVVINMDLKDFFPTIAYRRVKGLFVAIGYSEQIATILALLCTEPMIDEVELDGIKYFVARGERFLPQGAPTSPAITNLICYRLDHRFAGMAKKLGWTYTRYADDLTLSCKTSTQNINRILWQSRQIIDDEGFVIHPDKVEVMRKGSRQEVTGIVVNEKLNVSRTHLRQFRAVLHRIQQQGNAEGIQFGAANANPAQVIQGFANFVNMINPEKGAKLVDEVKAVLALPTLQNQLHSGNTPKKYEPITTKKVVEPTISTPSAKAENKSAAAPIDNWWDIFEA